MLTLFYFMLFLASILLVSIQPWWILHRYSNAMAFLLHRVIRYRVKVTRSNLRLAFPEKSDEELKKLEKGIYRNLADISVEALRGFTMRNSRIVERHKILNPELLQHYYSRGQSVIGVAGHTGNWEWGAMSAGIQLKHQPVALYKALSNKLVDWFMKWNRSMRGTLMAPISSTFETFEKHQHRPCIYLMVADQSPSNPSLAHWINFFNRETACIHGPEKYAKLYGYPVVFIDIRRAKRGFYEIKLTTLTEKPNELPEGELTRLYISRLEAAIRKAPESWLWSHRRWKWERASI